MPLKDGCLPYVVEAGKQASVILEKWTLRRWYDEFMICLSNFIDLLKLIKTRWFQTLYFIYFCSNQSGFICCSVVQIQKRKFEKAVELEVDVGSNWSPPVSSLPPWSPFFQFQADRIQGKEPDATIRRQCDERRELVDCSLQSSDYKSWNFIRTSMLEECKSKFCEDLMAQ